MIYIYLEKQPNYRLLEWKEKGLIASNEYEEVLSNKLKLRQ